MPWTVWMAEGRAVSRTWEWWDSREVVAVYCQRQVGIVMAVRVPRIALPDDAVNCRVGKQG